MNEWKEHQLDDKKFQKSDFCKKLFKIDETDVDISFKKEPYGTNKLIKYFIAYNDKDVIKPLCIKLPQLIGFVKYFDSNKTMSFKVTSKNLLKNYSKILEKIQQFNLYKTWL